METSIMPIAGCAGSDTLVPVPVVPGQQPQPTVTEPPATNNEQPVTQQSIALPRPKAALPAKLAVGTVHLRTPEEDAEFQECEAIVSQTSAHFARAGEALIRIRDKQLYKNEYLSFEVYCNQRWGFGRSTVWRYISVAQVVGSLAKVPGLPLPWDQR